MKIDIRNLDLIRELLEITDKEIKSDILKYSTLRYRLEEVLKKYSKNRMYYVSVEGEHIYKDSVFSSYKRCIELEKLAKQEYDNTEICSFEFNPLINKGDD